jgi:hypothetical protein
VRAVFQRTRVLIALSEVEQKLRHDADAVAENAVRERTLCHGTEIPTMLS